MTDCYTKRERCRGCKLVQRWSAPEICLKNVERSSVGRVSGGLMPLTTVVRCVQEQPDRAAADSKRPDDDEDRQNPAYVPRRGAFFEHDLRQGSDDEDSNTEPKPYVFLRFLDTCVPREGKRQQH